MGLYDITYINQIHHISYINNIRLFVHCVTMQIFIFHVEKLTVLKTAYVEIMNLIGHKVVELMSLIINVKSDFFRHFPPIQISHSMSKN